VVGVVPRAWSPPGGPSLVKRSTPPDSTTPVHSRTAINRLINIPLPYRLTDWCANVTAAGGCTVEHKGTRYHTIVPTVVPFALAAPLISARSRRTFHLYNVRSFLRLEIMGEE